MYATHGQVEESAKNNIQHRDELSILMFFSLCNVHGGMHVQQLQLHSEIILFYTNSLVCAGL